MPLTRNENPISNITRNGVALDSVTRNSVEVWMKSGHLSVFNSKTIKAGVDFPSHTPISFCIVGGGKGGNKSASNTGALGGEAGDVKTSTNKTFGYNDEITITLGAGGNGATSSGGAGGNGGDTTVVSGAIISETASGGTENYNGDFDFRTTCLGSSFDGSAETDSPRVFSGGQTAGATTGGDGSKSGAGGSANQGGSGGGGGYTKGGDGGKGYVKLSW